METKHQISFNRYVDQINSGQVASGRLIKLAIKRHLNDMKRKDIYLDYDIVNRICSFVELLNHWKGEWSGKGIKLEDHQVFYLGSLFGWINKETGLRRFRTSFKTRDVEGTF